VVRTVPLQGGGKEPDALLRLQALPERAVSPREEKKEGTSEIRVLSKGEERREALCFAVPRQGGGIRPLYST